MAVVVKSHLGYLPITYLKEYTTNYNLEKTSPDTIKFLTLLDKVSEYFQKNYKMILYFRFVVKKRTPQFTFLKAWERTLPLWA